MMYSKFMSKLYICYYIICFKYMGCHPTSIADNILNYLVSNMCCHPTSIVDNIQNRLIRQHWTLPLWRRPWKIKGINPCGLPAIMLRPKRTILLGVGWAMCCPCLKVVVGLCVRHERTATNNVQDSPQYLLHHRSAFLLKKKARIIKFSINFLTLFFFWTNRFTSQVINRFNNENRP